MKLFDTDKPFFKSRKFIVLFLTIVFYIINAILLRNKLPGIPIEYTYALIAAIVGWMASEGYVDGKREEAKVVNTGTVLSVVESTEETKDIKTEVEDKIVIQAGNKIAEATEKLIEGKRE